MWQLHDEETTVVPRDSAVPYLNLCRDQRGSPRLESQRAVQADGLVVGLIVIVSDSDGQRNTRGRRTKEELIPPSGLLFGAVTRGSANQSFSATSELPQFRCNRRWTVGIYVCL